MKLNQQATIAAVITMSPDQVMGGGAPIFVVENHKELQMVSMTLEKIMDASAHEITKETLVIVAR
ncbi:hypothetical protein [Sporosarcina sp. HYO08]|uniref:capping complex subunit for YIEGIA n=1 Tax=Sporosarcina sp. HYO08 TaxID=1759557 RepID=UPI000794C13F|nr:hypothetical protein AU377_05630 [Sporosarcina sp. HYO08]